jgi:hypothetical protein
MQNWKILFVTSPLNCPKVEESPLRNSFPVNNGTVGGRLSKFYYRVKPTNYVLCWDFKFDKSC